MELVLQITMEDRCYMIIIWHNYKSWPKCSSNKRCTTAKLKHRSNHLNASTSSKQKIYTTYTLINISNIARTNLEYWCQRQRRTITIYESWFVGHRQSQLFEWRPASESDTNRKQCIRKECLSLTRTSSYMRTFIEVRDDNSDWKIDINDLFIYSSRWCHWQ